MARKHVTTLDEAAGVLREYAAWEMKNGTGLRKLRLKMGLGCAAIAAEFGLLALLYQNILILPAGLAIALFFFLVFTLPPTVRRRIRYRRIMDGRFVESYRRRNREADVIRMANTWIDSRAKAEELLRPDADPPA